MTAPSAEGFAKPWLEFEKQVGQRLLIHGPTVENLFKEYESNGAILVSKLTFPAPDLSIKTEDKEISPGLKVRIYTPPNYKGNKPVCVFYHGGGWAMGDLEGEDIQLRIICKDTGVVIISVDYRLAPAHPFPAPLDDCVTAYKWALNNTSSLDTTPNQAFTFGTSAGGNLALCAALKIMDEGLGHTLKGVVAVVPVTIAPDEVPEELKSQYTSYKEHAENTINTESAMKLFFDAYTKDGKNPYVSPLLHKNLKKLPRVYVCGCGHDTLRDDARLLRSALGEAGVPNMYDEYPGYPHFFWSFPSEHLAVPTAEYHKNVAKGFKFVLRQDSSL